MEGRGPTLERDVCREGRVGALPWRGLCVGEGRWPTLEMAVLEGEGGRWPTLERDVLEGEGVGGLPWRGLGRG